jgi:hypothetical protein
MMKAIVTAFLCLATMACAAHATPITYNVNVTAGPGQFVTGTIITDGNLGLLAASDFTAVDIFITVAGTTREVKNQPTLISQIVNASTTGLSVDFGSAQTGFFGISNGINATLCFTTGNDRCSNGNSLEFNTSSVGVAGFDPSGVYTFATTPAAATPEPSSLFLLGTGALGLAGTGWRRVRRRRIG